MRNHDPEIMIKAFELVRLGEDDVKSKFPAMYNAFCYGAPPHAGIAPGVDRMVMLLAGEDSIREIIPFPMNKNAQDILMGAPSEVSAEAARRAAHRRHRARRVTEIKKPPSGWTGVPFMIGQAMHTKTPSTKEGAGRAKRGLGEFSFFSP